MDRGRVKVEEVGEAGRLEGEEGREVEEGEGRGEGRGRMERKCRHVY